jgi:uncharacterized protein YecT (DUF1311 family)
MAAVSAAAVGLLAGCGGASSPVAVRAADAASVSVNAPGSLRPAAMARPAAAVSAPVPFVPITEPFDPGHPARAKSSPASCTSQRTTIAIEQCYENKTETADAAIDKVRQASFTRSSAAQRAAINAADRGWLSARQTVCDKAFHSGGTIDGINVGDCLLAESTARLDAVKGITPPEAVLKSTDSDDLSELYWYTAPGGTRISMIDTQGDATGGVVISWVIIAGSGGFVVHPAQFPYRDGSFAVAGKTEGANPSGHRVATGQEYQFSLDYSHLPAAPGHGAGGGWDYLPGQKPVAVWR